MFNRRRSKSFHSYLPVVIPTHTLSPRSEKSIRVLPLNTLTSYDYGEPHRHDYFEFFVFLNGGGVHMIDFADFPIESGAIHIVAPGQVHLVKRALNSSGHVLLFEPDTFEAGHLVSEFLFKHICFGLDEFPPAYRFSSHEQIEISETLNQIWKNFNSDAPLKNEFVKSLLTALLIRCMRTRADAMPAGTSRHQGVYATFRRLLNTEFKNLKKVKDYAGALSVSEKQLNNIIQARTGLSASEVIHQQLILEARRLLKTGMLAKEVAYALNFDDPAHFSKFFKSQTGVSPADFQKIQH